MSWLCRDPTIFEEDLEVLDFEPTESQLVSIERQNNVGCIHHGPKSDENTFHVLTLRRLLTMQSRGR